MIKQLKNNLFKFIFKFLLLCFIIYLAFTNLSIMIDNSLSQVTYIAYRDNTFLFLNSLYLISTGIYFMRKTLMECE
jgi:hypothetical protein